MPGFLYYIDGQVNPLTDTVMSTAALRYAFDVVPMSGVIQGRTPGGDAGMLLADEARLAGRSFGYFPAEQIWCKRPGDDCVHIGYWRDAMPTPADLQRAAMLEGELLRLGDGREWLVPRLLFYLDGDGFTSALPHKAALDDAGHWVNGEVVPQYAELDEVARRIYEGMFKSELDLAPRISPTEMLEIACKLLAVNYCVSRVEVALLGLLSVDEQLKEIGRVAADYATFEKWFQKKTTASGPTTGGG